MPNPLVFPCSKRRTCPGVDLPIDNYSAEGAEPGPPYFAVVFPEPPNRPPREFFQQMGCLFMCTSWNSQAEVDACIAAQTPFCQEPPPGFFYAWGCKSVCVSSISQADADACAEAQLSQCQNDSVWQGQGCVSLCTSYISQEDADLCALRQASQCTNGSDGGGGGNDGTGGNGGGQGGEPQCNNTEVSCTYTLPDGTEFTYTVPAGTFCGETVQIANAQALAYACDQSSNPSNTIALSSLVTSCCNGTNFSKRISLTQNSQNGDWTLLSGAVPTGLTFHAGSGDTVLLDGTPTHNGDYTFAVRFTTPSGHTAERTYTLKVETCASGCGGPTAYAYYTLDETLGVIVHDLVGGENMVVNSLIDPVPGMINNAFHMTALANFAETISGNHFNMAGHSFSLRFWFKIDAPLPWPKFAVLLGFDSGNWTVGYSIAGPISGLTFRIQRATGGYHYAYGGQVTPGVWHRVCAWWQNGVQLGIKVDNDASVLAAATDVMKDNGPDGLFISPTLVLGAGLGHSIDEIAIWRDKVLTEAEMTCDWNGGIGTTYPNVP